MDIGYHEKLFCRCGADLRGGDVRDGRTVLCAACGAAAALTEAEALAYRAMNKAANRADCCKNPDNLSPRGEGVVKCSVCGARNMAFWEPAS